MRFQALLFLFLVIQSCDLDEINLAPSPSDLQGKWEVQENSSIFKKKAAGFYQVEIRLHNTDPSAILVQNFYSLSVELKAIIDGRKLIIPEQKLGGYFYNGSGNISSTVNRIDWSYTVDFTDGTIDTVTAVYSRIR